MRSFNAARYHDDEKAVAAYIDHVLETGDPARIAEALGVIARARGMTKIARKSAIPRESLYRTLSSKGNPAFGTILKVMKALDLKLSVHPSARKVDPPVTKGCGT